MSVVSIAERVIRVNAAGRIGTDLLGQLDPKIPTLFATCVHEAAHVSIGRRYGYPTWRVEVDPSDCSGMTRFTPACRPLDRVFSDDDSTVAVLSVLTPAEREQIDQAALEAETREQLQDDWAMVEAIARTLYCRTIGGCKAVVSGAEIDKLYEFQLEGAERCAAYS